ncbi:MULTISPECIES: wax ester/triacylglycerol synthase domain-containing protein [Gordonia]|uniref:diacylglycerol O-acyltransferase n=1 Tax=Gordonia tangerina TaxID=2911060 RepID=A0ABS9DT87_9ACTN|nr:wax ester/triacylglycerol synthase domain-containing protein [Gordonia tangerina]MCF3941161.1 WS/DGAT domain-containing protein [Gordonia tangerina]
MSNDALRMTQSDMFSWHMEQNPILRSTVVLVVLLDASPDWERFLATVERAAQVLPAMRRKLVPDRGLAPARWVDDPDFDLGWHVRRVDAPHPRNLAGVLEVARTAGMSAFDPARPMWEYTLLDGLEEDAAAAVVMKFHHSLTDGVGGVRIAAEILDFERSGTERDPVAHTEAVAAAPTVIDTIGWYASSAFTVARESVSSAARLGGRLLIRPLRAVRDVAGTAVSIARIVEPITSTASPVMTDRSTRRHFATMEAPVDALSAAGEVGGGTLNDAFLAAIVLGMRDYHRRHDAQIDHLRVTMPMNLRSDDDPLGGNRITLLRFAIPCDEGEPSKLIQRIHDIVAAWRVEPAVPLAEPIAGALNVLPASAVGAMLEHVDFLASDVPGSPVPLYLAGAKITRQYAFGPTIGAAFNVTLLSYVGDCCMGIDVDDAAVPDLNVLLDSLDAGFREVCGLADA